MNKNRMAALGLALLILGGQGIGGWAGTYAQDGDVFQGPESLIRGLYAAVSFDPGPGPDWEAVKRFFLPQAVLAVRMSATSMAVLDVRQFVDWFKGDLDKFKMKERGFEEKVEKVKLTVFGEIAHVFVVYRARLKNPPGPGQVGLDSWELVKKDGRWWIVGMTNEILTPQRALPEDLKLENR